MKRVLIVSPHFPPTNAADMHRVRLLCPYLNGAGIAPTVLAVRPEDIASPIDEWMLGGLPPELPVERVEALSLRWRRVPGLGTLNYRVHLAMKRAGSRHLSDGRKKGRPFDLVYFSTTQFGIHSLGPLWKRKYGVPFAMDYQDPWVSDYYRDHPDVTPPGGRLKYAMSRWISARTEPEVLRQCSGITSVSAAYPKQLHDRYSWLSSEFPTLVAPFPGDERDLTRVQHDPAIKQSVFDKSDGKLHWVYVGRGGMDMERAVRGLFAAIRNEMQTADRHGLDEPVGDRESTWANLHIHFIGTSYAAAGAGKKTIEPLAKDYGLDAVVREHTDRIPYSQTLRCLLDADALVVPGSDDPAYTASKIYPFLLARKPMLAIFREESSVSELVRKCGGSSLATFDETTTEDELADRITKVWFRESRWRSPVSLSEHEFAPYTAKAQAEVLANFLRQVIE